MALDTTYRRYRISRGEKTHSQHMATWLYHEFFLQAMPLLP